MDKKQKLYEQAINILKIIDIVVKNKKYHHLLRKQILDLANNIKRMDDVNG